MNAKLIGTVGEDLTREEWLVLRKSGIGGSEAPAICGAVNWASPMSVYLDKLELTDKKEINESMEWGNRLEVPVTEKVEEVTGHEVVSRQMFCSHKDYPWMLATVDGVTENDNGEQGLVEIKTTGSWRGKTWADDVPLHVFVQVEHDLAVTGLPWAIVGVLIGGQHFQLHTVKRDDEYIEQLIALEKDFYTNHLEPQVPPAIDGSTSAEDMLKILFPADDGTEATRDEPEIIAAAKRYLEEAEECRIQEKEKRAAANKLKEMIGSSERVTIGGKYIATWKTVVRRSKNGKETSFRKFEVKEITDRDA